VYLQWQNVITKKYENLMTAREKTIFKALVLRLCYVVFSIASSKDSLHWNFLQNLCNSDSVFSSLGSLCSSRTKGIVSICYHADQGAKASKATIPVSQVFLPV
jgi:hypothetical protein